MFYLFITIFGYFYKVDQLDKISQLKVNILLLYSAQIKREGLGPAPPLPHGKPKLIYPLPHPSKHNYPLDIPPLESVHVYIHSQI